MTTDFERTRGQARNRFGQLSKNMFFARHVAQPRYLKFITGAVGQRICCVREEPLCLPTNTLGSLTKPIMSDPYFNISFVSNPYNEYLLRLYASRIQPKKRRERLLPPIPGWSLSGTVVEDIENWRRELARIGEMVGLVTSDELLEIQSRRDTSETHEYRPFTAINTRGQYSQQSGRWNETPKSSKRSRSLPRRTSAKPYSTDRFICVDEQEREMWMLQVLCQILQTESLTEIQSWLVSSGPREKEAVRQLITKAIKGLEESGRIQTSEINDENAKAIQVNMDAFGSLLANKFPCVSSTNPTVSANVDPLKAMTPLKPGSSRSVTRPRTAPAARNQISTGTEFHSKSTGTFSTKLEQVNESSEIRSSSTNVDTPRPTPIDTDHDVQILKLDDAENEYQGNIREIDNQIPF